MDLLFGSRPGSGTWGVQPQLGGQLLKNPGPSWMLSGGLVSMPIKDLGPSFSGYMGIGSGLTIQVN